MRSGSNKTRCFAGSDFINDA
ncbi:unnamed protein product, partial [Rotaria sp. Silwood2]